MADTPVICTSPNNIDTVKHPGVPVQKKSKPQLLTCLFNKIQPEKIYCVFFKYKLYKGEA